MERVLDVYFTQFICYLHMTTFCIRRVLDFETSTKPAGHLSAGYFGLSITKHAAVLIQYKLK